MTATASLPALDIGGLRRTADAVLLRVSPARRPRFAALVADVLDRAALAVALDDETAAHDWAALLRRRLDAWATSDSVTRDGIEQPCDDAFLRTWRAPGEYGRRRHLRPAAAIISRKLRAEGPMLPDGCTEHGLDVVQPGREQETALHGDAMEATR